MTLSDRLFSRAGHRRDLASGARWDLALALYIAVFVVAWATVPSAINREPPIDNFEQLAWAERLAWGFDKHPPLPTMILWAFERVFPTGIPLTYALGGLEVATLLALAWAITRRTLDHRRAAMAVLFVSCVTYYTRRLHFYNHNTGLLVASAMSLYCVGRAAQSGRARWYALLGACWGLGLLSKYQMVVAIACNVIFLVWAVQFRVRKLLAPLIVATGVCAIVIAPHLLWLIEHRFPSFDYAAKYVAANLPWWQRPGDILRFLAEQSGRVIPLALLLILLRLLPRLRALGEDASIAMADASALAAPLLAIHAWGPFLLMASLSLLFGVDLEMHWGTAFLWTLPMWFLRTQHGRAISHLPLATIFTAVIALQIVMLLTYR